MATRKFHYVEYCLSDHDSGREAYEELMQDILVDDPQNHELIAETSTWTKDGQHMISISYIKTEPDERY